MSAEKEMTTNQERGKFEALRESLREASKREERTYANEETELAYLTWQAALQGGSPVYQRYVNESWVDIPKENYDQWHGKWQCRILYTRPPYASDARDGVAELIAISKLTLDEIEGCGVTHEKRLRAAIAKLSAAKESK